MTRSQNHPADTSRAQTSLDAIAIRDLERKANHLTQPPPCPSWCTNSTVDHRTGYDMVASDDPDAFSRLHVRAFGDVSIVQQETSRHRVMTLAPPTIEIYVEDTPSPTVAREIAQSLTAAAAFLERISDGTAHPSAAPLPGHASWCMHPTGCGHGECCYWAPSTPGEGQVVAMRQTVSDVKRGLRVPLMLWFGVARCSPAHQELHDGTEDHRITLVVDRDGDNEETDLTVPEARKLHLQLTQAIEWADADAEVQR